MLCATACVCRFVVYGMANGFLAELHGGSLRCDENTHSFTGLQGGVHHLLWYIIHTCSTRAGKSLNCRQFRNAAVSTTSSFSFNLCDVCQCFPTKMSRPHTWSPWGTYRHTRLAPAQVGNGVDVGRQMRAQSVVLRFDTERTGLAFFRGKMAAGEGLL